MNTEKKVRREAVEILVVEDSPTQAEMLRHLLEQHDYKVEVANNGRQALALLDKNKPGLIISDIVMPEMDGYTLCRHIKDDSRTQNIPVILLTSLTDPEDVLNGLECGADNFITKPYDEEYLIRHVDQIIASSKICKSERVRVGIEIMFGGKRRFITADQQQMLSLLISTYEEAVRKNTELVKTQNMFKSLNERLAGLVEERTAALTVEIDTRKRAEDRILKLNRVYAMLSNINQAIVRIREPQALFKEACRIAVEEGGFKMAWIGHADCVTGKITAVASAGAAGSYLEKAHITFNGETQGNCPAGSVLTTGRHFICNDMENGPCQASWREEALNMGFRSSIVFPLKVSGRVRGLFQLYTDETGFFDDEELKLLDELAMDISFAMEFAEKESESRRAEKELVASETRYRRLFESAKDGILIFDADTGLIIDVNPFLIDLLGYSKEHFLGERLWEIGLFKDISASRESFLELQEKKYIRYENLPLQTANGRTINVEFVSNVYLVNGGKVIQCNIRDITERKQAEEQLRFKNIILSTQQETSIDGILVVDKNGMIISYNRLLAEMWGIPAGLIESKSDEHVLQSVMDKITDPDEFMLKIKYLYGARNETSRDEIALRDGRTFDRYSAPMFGENEKYYGRVWYFRDITKRKQTEEKQKKLEEQLRQSQKLESIGQLSSGVAHDFNNLLGGIMGNAELLKMGLEKDSPLMRHPESIISTCMKAADLTRQLLIFARKATVEFQKVDLNDFINQVVKLMRRTIDHSIEIAVDLQERPVVISADRNQLENAILNIAINARDAMPEGGRLCIASETVNLNKDTLQDAHFEGVEGAYVRISITDTGTGMSKETTDRVFEPFFTTKEVGKGTGLGLASVYGCVKQHNGYITVESQVGKGTTFHIYLPEANSAEPVTDTQEDLALIPGKGSLLVVDDEPVYHEIVDKIFGGLGYSVHCCASGPDAIAYYREHASAIDLVILDMNMPKMNGLQCFRGLKAINHGVKVIVASGYGDNSDRQAMVKEGVGVFVQKPFKAADLAKKIRELMAS